MIKQAPWSKKSAKAISEVDVSCKGITVAKRKILLLQSRDYESSPYSGRKVIFKNYYKYLQDKFDLETMTVESPLHSKSLGVWLSFFYTFLIGLVQGRFSMQSALFLGPKNKCAVRSKVEEGRYSLILVDSVRLASLVEGIEFSGRLVLDMDDLMSARYEQYALKCEEMEFGILAAKLSFLKRVIPSRVLQYLLSRESTKLSLEEERAIGSFDRIIFTSPTELVKFKDRYSIDDRKLLSQVIPTEPIYESESLKLNDDECISFGFIGSDEVIQNRKTIEYLIRLWGEKRIGHRLVIAGKMQRAYEVSENVIFLGYVGSLSDFYRHIDVLLAPSFVEGGVKTKVLEAFSYGKLVLGNDVTFDGIPIDDDYPLLLNDEDMSSFCSMCAGDIEAVLKASGNHRTKVLERSSWDTYCHFAREAFC